MTPERYSQVKSLFQLVLQQPHETRHPFLEQACGADRELFTRVQELLVADSSSHDFLEKPAVTPISQILAEQSKAIEEPMPATIGPYAISRQIGSGGMGSVYLAARADQSYTREVAIKVIRRGMETDRILQRFRTERQIIASLDHPNIARLLDGGATADGRPYIVMEYVQGMPIDAWCDQRRLNVTERLKLFLQVCSAVHYAHQNLVIHRDIKPGNIIVRPDNTVKLLDFGIAKLLHQDQSRKVAEKTATSLRLMTPQYASPEQLKGETINTSSDVYLLGIVLFELVTGHRPYALKDSGSMEALRAFATGEPQRPSEAIHRITESLLLDGSRKVTRNAAIVSATRDGTPSMLQRRLRGDLDEIILRALRRNPAERYQSAAQLAEDIQNHLTNMPVMARPQSMWYRAKLAVKRKRGLTAALAAAFILVLSSSVFAFWQARNAELQRQRAEHRFEQVQKMSNSLLFEVQEALGNLPGTTPARRLLVEKGLVYLNGLAAEATGDTNLQREIAAAYLRLGHLQGNPNFANIGDTAGAMESYRTAQRLQEQIIAAEPGNKSLQGELAGSLEALADLRITNGDSAGASELVRKAVALRESSGLSPEAVAASYQNLSQLLSQTGDSAEALRFADKSLEIIARLSGPKNNRLLGIALGKQAIVKDRAGDRNAATQGFQKSLAILRQLAAADPESARARRDLSFALEDFADFQRRQGQSGEAEQIYAESLAIRRELSQSDPTNIQARRDLAYAFLKSGDPEAAIAILNVLANGDTRNFMLSRDLALAWEKQGNKLRANGQTAQALSAYGVLLQTARSWVQKDPRNFFANHLLAVANLKMGEVLPQNGEIPGALRSIDAAHNLLLELQKKDGQNVLLRRDAALTEWVRARAMAEAARRSNKPSDWRGALEQFNKAEVLFSKLQTEKLLSGDDRLIPAAVSAQIAEAKRALELSQSVSM